MGVGEAVYRPGQICDARPKWLTYKQAVEAGGHVRKGEKSSQIVYLGSIAKPDDETGEPRKVAFLKSYAVFNLAQCKVLGHLVDSLPREVNPDRRDELAEGVHSVERRSRHAWREPRLLFEPGRSGEPAAVRGLPKRRELLRHRVPRNTRDGAEHRLNRMFGKRFGDEAYSAEELVAELGSAFLCAEFGYDNQTIENQAAYIDHWRRFLSGHERTFVTAASAASKAVDYLRGKVLASERAV